MTEIDSLLTKINYINNAASTETADLLREEALRVTAIQDEVAGRIRQLNRKKDEEINNILVRINVIRNK